MRHVPVLLNEVIDGLNLHAGDRVVDCTLGDAGHSEKILEKIGPTGKLLGIDADPESLLRAKQYLYNFERQIALIRDNFINLARILTDNNFTSVNAILMDLGWSAPQFEERGRGFSFLKDEPLDMRYGGNIKYQKSNIKNVERTAADLLNNANAEELRMIFKNYGEEKFAAAIAAAIVKERNSRPLERTGQLVEIILSVYREKLGSVREIPWAGGIHPATRVFQALRIAVNGELEALKSALPQALAALSSGGRLAVITFHSLEDRIVKQFFQKASGRALKIITKKPITASDEELKINPRARSAKLRIAEKI